MCANDDDDRHANVNFFMMVDKYFSSFFCDIMHYGCVWSVITIEGKLI